MSRPDDGRPDNDGRPDIEHYEALAERRIREAEARGEFDNLPGSGRPIPGLEHPHDDNWWLKQWVRREGLSILPRERGRGAGRLPAFPPWRTRSAVPPRPGRLPLAARDHHLGRTTFFFLT